MRTPTRSSAKPTEHEQSLCESVAGQFYSGHERRRTRDPRQPNNQNLSGKREKKINWLGDEQKQKEQRLHKIADTAQPPKSSNRR
jgi:hypothetical protein